MVRMAPRLTFGTGMADWQERINVQRMREERAARARRAMKQFGVPALLVTRGDNCRYLTGLTGPEWLPQLWYVLFFAEGDPVVFAHAGLYTEMPDQAPWIKDWRIARAWLGGNPGQAAADEEAKLFASEIEAELVKRGLQDERLATIAFDGRALGALRAEGLKVEDGWPLMLEARKSKTVDEVNCLKMAAAITDVCWYETQQCLRPGIPDWEVSRQAAHAAWTAGAEEVPAFAIFSGPGSFDRGFRATGRFIQTGDLVYGAYCGLKYMGYRSCYYRTFIVGREPNAQEKDWYQRLLDRIDAVISEIKPGRTTADAAKHFPPASAWGYKEEAELLTLEIGHGVGLYGYEYPVINRQFSLKHPQVFEPGMVIAVEGREGVRRVGGVRLENMVHVTEDGAEILDYFPRDRIIVAGAI